jgi:hypothetical protein
MLIAIPHIATLIMVPTDQPVSWWSIGNEKAFCTVKNHLL